MIPTRYIAAGATQKDIERMERLIEYSRKNGLKLGVLKAERDAEKIENPAKLRARAAILEGEGHKALAAPFRAREKWLAAQGVV